MNNTREEYNDFLKSLTDFGKINKTKGIIINSDIKMKTDTYQDTNTNNVALVLFYKQNKKQSSYPFLCDI